MIGLLFALAVAAFVLSLPIAKTQLGARLRQIAGVALLLALLPSIICGLFFADIDGAQPGAPSSAPASVWEQLTRGLSCFGACVLLTLIAYGILKLRSRFASKAKPRDPWESFFNRGSGKRPFTMNPRATRSRGPFGFDEDEN